MDPVEKSGYYYANKFSLIMLDTHQTTMDQEEVMVGVAQVAAEEVVMEADIHPSTLGHVKMTNLSR